MTLAELFSAAAGAGCIGFSLVEDRYPSFSLMCQYIHHLDCCVTSTDQPCHDLHREIDMMEELFETRAKVIQAGFFIRGYDKAVLGALAMARKADITVKTVLRKRIPFIQAELPMLWRGYQLYHVLVLDIPEEVIGFDEMVASIQVTIMFQGNTQTAGRIENAHAGRRHVQPVANGCLKCLHKHVPDIVMDPFIKDGA